jgi:RNA polymerase primary sigma factor
MMPSIVRDREVWVEKEDREFSGQRQMYTTRRSEKPYTTFDTTAEYSALVDDYLVSEYFVELRRFDLLNWEEETALWQRIERCKTRARRALYTSPIALSTLEAIWSKVQNDEGALPQIMGHTGASVDQQTIAYRHMEQALQHLSELSARLRCVRQQRPRRSRSRRERRGRRQACLSIWRDWLDTWEGLSLHPSVHETMWQALDIERRAHPDDVALRAAQHGWQRAQRQLEQAKTQMLCANLRLVVHVAKKYRDQDVPLLDLIQEGNIGLMRAIDRFNPERGFKFATYAYWWIRQAISRSVVEQGGAIRIPTHVIERQHKLRATSDQLYQVHGRIPTAQELSAQLGWTPNEIERLRGSQQTVLRLNTPLSEDGWTLEDVVKDERLSSPEAQFEALELQQCLASGLDALTRREALVLSLRFGLQHDRTHNLREIGERLGLSHERIRQIEQIALEKLRAPELGLRLPCAKDRRLQG